MTDCFFAGLGYKGCRFREDGQLDRAHLIPAQRLRIAKVDHDSIWDERAWVWACRRHHDQADGRDALNKINLKRHQLPAAVEEYAREHGLEWSLSRDYGEATQVSG